MGIKGLLQMLKEQQEIVNLKSFRGCTAAVDVYCWLHKAVYGCVDQIAIAGNDQGQYIAYCERYWNTLKKFGIKPILVFDGQNLPAKSHTEKERRERRKANRDKANSLLAEGKRSEARQYFERCIDITPQMAHKVIVAAVSQGIDCIVAPYEADAQLAYLSLSGVAQLIISEDSDLLCFGCERILFKMDLNGNGILQERSSVLEHKAFRKRFTMDHFVMMCILSGCDYLPSLPGIGLAKATKFMSQSYNSTDISSMLRRLPLSIKLPSGVITDEYIQQFTNAVVTFKHQVVFNPKTRKRQPLTPVTDTCCGIQGHPQDMAFAGRFYPADQALQMALGNTDLRTMETLLPEIDPDLLLSRENGKLSIWHPEYKPKGEWSRGDNRSVDKVEHTSRETCVLIPTTRIVRKRALSQTESQESATDISQNSQLSQFSQQESLSTVQVINKVMKMESQYSGNSDNEEGVGNEIQDFLKGPADPPKPHTSSFARDKLRNLYHEEQSMGQELTVKSRFFSKGSEPVDSPRRSQSHSLSQSLSISQSQDVVLQEPLKSMPTSPYKSNLLKVLEDNVETKPSLQSRAFRWSKSSLHSIDAIKETKSPNLQFKSPLLKSKLVQQLQQSSTSKDTANNLPVADSSGLTAGTPSSPHLSPNSTNSSSSQANAVNGNSSNPFKKSNTSTPSATPTPVFGNCVQETTTPKEDNSKDVFSMSPLSRMGKSPSSKEKLLTTQKLFKYQTSKRKSLLGSITGNKDLEMETADAMASEEQIKTATAENSHTSDLLSQPTAKRPGEQKTLSNSFQSNKIAMSDSPTKSGSTKLHNVVPVTSKEVAMAISNSPGSKSEISEVMDTSCKVDHLRDSKENKRASISNFLAQFKRVKPDKVGAPLNTPSNRIIDLT